MPDSWWYSKWNRPEFNIRFAQYITAEFIGTVLYMVGIMNLSYGGLDVTVQALGRASLAISISFAFALRFNTYFNPTVNFGLLIGSNLNIWLGISLMIAEFLAALVAGGFLLVIHPELNDGMASKEISFQPENEVTNLSILFSEFIATAILVITVLRFVEDDVNNPEKNPDKRMNLIIRNSFRKFAIGFTRGYLLLPTFYTSLAAYNTAEVVSVCVITQRCSKLWVYIVGNVGGAVFAGLLNYAFLM